MISRNANCPFIAPFPAANTNIEDIWIFIFKNQAYYLFQRFEHWSWFDLARTFRTRSTFHQWLLQKRQRTFSSFQIGRKWNLRTNDFMPLEKGNINFKYTSSYKRRVIVLQIKAVQFTLDLWQSSCLFLP